MGRRNNFSADMINLVRQHIPTEAEGGRRILDIHKSMGMWALGTVAGVITHLVWIGEVGHTGPIGQRSYFLIHPKETGTK